MWWLLGFGDDVVIQELAELRDEFAKIAVRCGWRLRTPECDDWYRPRLEARHMAPEMFVK